jgi:hypothetical protein
MTGRRLFIDGLAAWTPTLADWEHAGAGAAQADQPLADAGAPAPQPQPAGRQRTPPRARQRAAWRCRWRRRPWRLRGTTPPGWPASSPRPTATCPSPTRCAARWPPTRWLLSPTRFHHSVHNAASGYWAIASHSQGRQHRAVGGAHSFAAGLLEAACQCAADGQPVLLVACDTAGHRAAGLRQPQPRLLALALVLASHPGRLRPGRWTGSWGPARAGAALAQPQRAAARTERQWRRAAAAAGTGRWRAGGNGAAHWARRWPCR